RRTGPQFPPQAVTRPRSVRILCRMHIHALSSPAASSTTSSAASCATSSATSRSGASAARFSVAITASRGLLAALLCATLGACAVAPKSTGVVDLGNNHFRITARGAMGVPAESRKVALTQADEFCAARNEAMQVTETGKAPLAGPYEVTFTCLPDDNPEATRNVVRRAPAQVQPVK
ncbi:MAG: hypothetical protein JWQ88_564, partial [Rhodoferax sp.]|nr:hypothetical protein [Rhodoferax sp.]